MTKEHIFLSYCRDNLEGVERLCNDLTKGGVQVWWDKNILVGQDWQYEINKALASSYAVVFCLSRELQARNESGMYPEISDAIARYRKQAPGQIFLLPVRLSDCSIPHIKIDETRYLDSLQYIDLFPHDNYQRGVDQLILALRKCRNNPTVIQQSIDVQDSMDNSTSIIDEAIVRPQKPDSVTTKEEVVEFELTINIPFAEFTEKQENDIGRAICNLLKTGNVIISNKREGSTKLTLRLSPEEAERLLWLVKAGDLDHLGVTGGRILDSSHAPTVVVNDESSFYSEIFNSDIPLLVVYWAAWCGVCKNIMPIIDKVAAELSGRIKICKVNIEEQRVLAMQYGVMSVPTIHLFRDGIVVDQIGGVTPSFEADLKEHINELLKPRSEEKKTEAVEQLKANESKMSSEQDCELSETYGVSQTEDAVMFVVLYPKANSVKLAGDFNEWQPDNTPMERVGQSGVWRVKVPLDQGVYRYRLVVDGQWQQDPYNDWTETNPYGDSVSIIEVQ